MSPRDIPVGPGGGALQSGALRIARIALGAALDAAVSPGTADTVLPQPMELLRQLVTMARRRQTGDGAVALPDTSAAHLPPVDDMGEGALVDELVGWFRSMPWPDWVPPVGFIVAGRQEPGDGSVDAQQAPRVRCPLLAARLITGMRGTVFLRDAAPALSSLLVKNEREAAVYGVRDLWLPITPGRARAAPRLADDLAGGIQ